MYLFPNTVVARMLGRDVGGDVLDVALIHVQGESGFGRAMIIDHLDAGDAADLHAVVGHLRPRFDHQARARRQQGQLSLVGEVATELQIDECRDE
jgi:hypothetical protein